MGENPRNQKVDLVSGTGGARNQRWGVPTAIPFHAEANCHPGFVPAVSLIIHTSVSFSYVIISKFTE